MADSFEKLRQWQKRLRKASAVTDEVWVDYLDAILCGEFWEDDGLGYGTWDAWDVFFDKNPSVARAALEGVSRTAGHPDAPAGEIIASAIENAEISIVAGVLEELRQTLRGLTAELGLRDAGDEVGLMLSGRPSNDSRYLETPANALIFGSTGGNGEHYSLLVVDRRIDDESPVVLTVPGSEPANTLVGANLRDFLDGGCRLGWFSLWSHFGRRSGDVLAADPSCLWPDKERVLERLRETLDLNEWPDPATRAQELANTFDDAVVLPYYVDLDYRP